MELINTLTVREFPGLKDGTHKFSQDVIIEGDRGSGKTSILKAITRLLTGKDLQGKSIPNITDKTTVVSRGHIELQRTKTNGLKGQLNRILQGTHDEILSRIIPGYIFNGGISNKKIAEMLTGIKIDERTNNAGKTIKQLEEGIKNQQKYQSLIQITSARIYSLVNVLGIKDKKLLSGLIDVKDLLEFDIAYSGFYRTFIEEYTVYRSFVIDGGSGSIIKKKEAEAKEKILKQINNKILKSHVEFAFDKEGTSFNSHKNYFYNIKDRIYGICRQLRNDLSGIYNISINGKNTQEYYDKTFKELTKLSNYKKEKDILVTSVYKHINEKLNPAGFALGLNNSLKTKVEYDGKEMTIVELPSHIRFLMEVNVCSRLQLNYIESNYRNTNASGLILIDDYRFKDDEDSIDALLREGLSHQVILTKQTPGAEGLKFIL